MSAEAGCLPSVGSVEHVNEFCEGVSDGANQKVTITDLDEQLEEAKTLLTGADGYRQELAQEIEGLLASKRRSPKLALITPDRDNTEYALLHAWLSRHYPGTWVAPDGGDLKNLDDEGNLVSFEPAEYQLFWIHQLNAADPGPATPTPDILMPGLVAQAEEMVAAIEAGSGMLLTGLAPLYALALEHSPGEPFESVMPDPRAIRENRYFLHCKGQDPDEAIGCVGLDAELPEYDLPTEGGKYPGESFRVGLAPTNADHPLFAALRQPLGPLEGDELDPPIAGAFWTNENPVSHLTMNAENLIPECAWIERDQQPEGGQVLARLFNAPPDPPHTLENYAAMVEYTHGEGRVISCGALACDLTPQPSRAIFPNDPMKLRKRIRTVMLEVLDYLNDGGPVGKLAFVTSTASAGALGGLAGADETCVNLASAAGLPGEFLAWLADDTASPLTRFVQSAGPYLRTDGVRIADDWADLTDGTLLAPLNRDQTGAEVTGGVWTWTGCDSWNSTAGQGNFGRSYTEDSNWEFADTDACDYPRSLYCFKQ